LAALTDQQSKTYSRIKNHFIEELLGGLSGKRFLDVGCGAGLFVEHAAASGARLVVGMDAEWTVLSAAMSLAGRRGSGEPGHFLCCDRASAIRPAKPFDAVLLKDVLEHVPDDRSLLRDMAAVTAPGGIMVVSTQNSWSLNYLIEGTCRRTILRQKEWYGWDPTHIRFYTPFGLRRRLCEAGFRCVEWRAIYLVPYKIPLPHGTRRFLRIDGLSWMDRLIGRITPFNRLGWNVIVKARRGEC